MSNSVTEYVVVGDVGGTNVRFAIAKDPKRYGGSVEIEEFWKSPNVNHETFTDALDDFLKTVDVKPQRGVFALAGPMKGNTVTLTNHSCWKVDGDQIAQQFDIDEVLLLNDFAAMARSVPELSLGSGLTNLAEGSACKESPIIVAGPGTGFGQAALLPEADNKWRVIRGEGGHQAFAPTTALEAEVYKNLFKRLSYVSVEIVSAGVGFETLLEVMFEVFGVNSQKFSPQQVHDLAKTGDKVCDAVCRIRANAVMTAYGDAVLAFGAKGGVVAAGGVTTALSDFISSPEALSRFYDRGPMSPYMVNVPIHLITSAEAPLIGAAAF